MSLGERASKAANTVYQATEDAIITASYHYVSSWPIMRAYASTDQSKVQNIDSAAFIGWQGTDDDGGKQGSITFVVRKDEYWQVYINGNYSNFVCWYTPLSGGTSQVPAHDHPELSDNDHEHDPHQNVDCTAVGEDCRTAISELDESTSLNANDEFIISTKDSSNIYSSKKVKLSTVQNASPAAGITVKEEGTALATNATSLNFVGSTVTASGTGAEKTITISEPAGGGNPGGNYSTGWVQTDDNGNSVTNGATLTFSHNLGTTDFVTQVFVSKNSTGTNGVQAVDTVVGTIGNAFGALVKEVTSTSITVQVGGDGYIELINNGTDQILSWGGTWIKVVAVK
tara:strand:+ start:3350 stop:4375 length:1026 start_codon:yes stop_codon:yes gene_type:complete